MEGNPSGLYFVKVNLKNPIILKKIKDSLKIIFKVRI